VSEHQPTDPDFLPEDFRFTATLLRQYSAPGRAAPPGNLKLFQAVCSNNLNIILAALDHAARCEEIEP
jgi:hypothetical protein